MGSPAAKEDKRMCHVTKNYSADGGDTLVIGGKKDRIVTGQASIEMAERIPGCRLLMYEGLGHGLYEEAPDFLKVVADFCR
jgi:pimeloyl-ACP methyl ester carboxylesterase